MCSLKVVPFLFKEQGEVLLLRFANDLEDYAKVDQMPVLEGKTYDYSAFPEEERDAKEACCTEICRCSESKLRLNQKNKRNE